MSIELTERLLMDAGGWQAVKHARALLDSGRVVSAAYLPPVLKGVIREGTSEFRAGLKIVSKSNIENICTCRDSREWGTICAHSLALGFAVLKARSGGGATSTGGDLAATPPPSPSASLSASSSGTARRESGPAAPASQSAKGPHFSTDTGESVALFVVFPPNWVTAWERGNVTVG